MPDRLSIHEPVLVNTIGHCAGAIIFGILLYFFAVNWMRAREKRSILPALAAVLAMLWNLGSLIALAGGPNFAGHVTATLTPCGPACGRLVLVDWNTGAVQGLPNLPAEIQGILPCRTDEAVLFRRDSRLLSISRAHGASVVTQYFVWNQKNAALAQNIEYQRTSQTFCAVAAR